MALTRQTAFAGAPLQTGGRTLGQNIARMGETFGLTRGKGRLALPVVLYLVAIAVPIAFYAGPLYMTTLRLLLLVMIVPLTIRLVLGHFGRILPTDILFFLHIAWAGVAIAVNSPAQLVLHIGSNGIEFLGGYVLARAYIRSAEDFTALCRGIIFVTLCSLPFAILETRSGHPMIVEWIRSIPGLTSVVPVDIEKRMGLERVQVMFAHPIHYGLFASVAFSMAFVGMKGLYGTGTRWLISAAVALCVFLSLSSGALLALVLQLALIFWAFALRNVQRRWLILLGLFAVLYVAIDVFSTRTPLRVFMSYATFSAHNAYWRSIIFDWGIINVQSNPLFGIGLRNWVRPHFMNSASVDNFWLLMTMRYGIPGFALLAAGYILGMFQVGRRDFNASPLLLQLRRVWMFTFLGLTFTLATVHIWTAAYSFVFFVYGAGLWMITTQGAPEAGAPGATALDGTALDRTALAGGRARSTGAATAQRDRDAPVFARTPEPPLPRQDAALPAVPRSGLALARGAPQDPARTAGDAQRYTRFPPGGSRDDLPRG